MASKQIIIDYDEYLKLERKVSIDDWFIHTLKAKAKGFVDEDGKQIYSHTIDMAFQGAEYRATITITKIKG